MTITIDRLPRGTTYAMRAISSANDLRPAFGGGVQRLARKGSRWAIDVTIPALAFRCSGAELIADLVRGETELIRLAIPEDGDNPPFGGAVVSGAGQSGTTLVSEGLAPHVVVRKGKFLSFEVAGQGFLYMATQEVVAEAAGATDLPIWPMLRASPADGAALELHKPMIEGFVQPGQEWSISTLRAVGLSFTIEERE